MNHQVNKIPVLVSIVLAMLVSSLDTTIMNTTMPIIAEELGKFDLYAWSFTTYIIASTAVMPIAGRISDIFGRKRVFAAGIILFLFGSILCGMSASMIQLVAFRAVQGFGAGIMMPLVITIAGDLYNVEQRGKIQAVFSTMWSLSAIIAPLLGALFVEYLTWRWVFYINIPVCAVSLLLLMRYKEVYKSHKSKVDVVGSMLFAVGISVLLLTTVVKELAFVYAAAGAGLLVLFVLFERKQETPIVPRDMLKVRAVSWMLVNSFLICAALFGASNFVPLFLQHQGYSVFMSGVALLGMSIGWMLMSVKSGTWILKFGYRPLIVVGNVMLVASGSLFLFLSEATGFWYMFFAMTMQGLAFGLIVTVSTIGAQQLVDPSQKGVSTSLQLLSRNIGLAVGVTIMGMFLASSDNFYTGFHRLFLYGFLLSIAGALASLFIGNAREPGTGTEAAPTNVARTEP